MIIELTKEQWRQLYEAYSRQYSMAHKKVLDNQKYIEEFKGTQWLQTDEQMFWRKKELNAAQNKEELCAGILAALENAKENEN